MEFKKNIEKLSEYHNKDVNIGKDHRMWSLHVGHGATCHSHTDGIFQIHPDIRNVLVNLIV